MSSLCVTFTPFRIFCLSTTVLAGAFAIVIIAYGIIKSISLKQLRLLKPFLIVYYITCTLWIIGVVGYTVFEGLPYSANICAKPNSFTVINYIGVCMGFAGYVLGLVGIYFIFLLRLKYHFVDTVLQLSNNKYYMLLSGVFVQFALLVMTTYYYVTFQWDIGLILSYSLIIINAIYSVSLLILFSLNICRLQTHFRHQSEIKHKNRARECISAPPPNQSEELEEDVESLQTVTSTEQSANTIHSNHPHNALAETTVKFIICATCAFSSSILVNFMSFYRGFIVSEDTFDLLMFHVTLNVVDCLVTVICLHLQFSHTNGCYTKLCKCLRLPLKSYVLRRFDRHEAVQSITGEMKLPRLGRVTKLQIDSRTFPL